jgi:hypothetical protein
MRAVKSLGDGVYPVVAVVEVGDARPCRRTPLGDEGRS